MKIRNFFVFLLIIFLVSVPTANAQEIPPDVGNSQVLEAKGAAFKEGWNYFRLGFGDCTAETVLNELQADGGGALKVNEFYIKEAFNWEPYSFFNNKSKEKRIGSNQTLAFYSNQKFFLEFDQKTCLFPDSQREAQIKEVREGRNNQSFVEKVRDLPADLWTKLTDLLSKNETSVQNSGGKQVFENLTIGGRTTVNDLGVTGKITSGLISIDGLVPSINSLSELKIQDQSLGPINFLNGKLIIDTSGNLKVQKLIVDDSDISSSSTGRSVITAGKTSVKVTTSAVTASSKVFVTPISDTDKPLIVKNKISGQSFDVYIVSPYSSDIAFDWFFIN